jgi:hypothetical protein
VHFAAEQVTPPVQRSHFTSQLAPAQVTVPHAPSPELVQAILQVGESHVTLAHASVPLHDTSQAIPGGHVTSPHFAVAVQEKRHRSPPSLNRHCPPAARH